MTGCPTSEVLHDLLDQTIEGVHRRELEGHLRDCTPCRDGLRALRRVDQFCARAEHPSVAPAPEDVAAVVSGARRRMRATERPSRPHLRVARIQRRLVPLAAAMLLTAMIVSNLLSSRDVAVLATPEAAPDAATVLTRLLEEIESDLSRPISETVFAEELRTSCAASPIFTPWGAGARERAARHLGVILASGATSGIRLRAARGLAVLGRRRAVTATQNLLLARDLGDEFVPYGLGILGELGGRSGLRALKRVAARRPCPPVALARAFIKTGSPRVARRVRDLLSEGHVELDRACLLLARVPGEEAARILVERFLAGMQSDILRDILLGRPEARRILEDGLDDLRNLRRVRALGLLSRAGSREALSGLERLLDRPQLFAPVRQILQRLERAGVQGAARVLVRGLPIATLPVDWTRGGREAQLCEAIRSLSPGGREEVLGSFGADRLRDDERRQLLLAAGLIGSDRALVILDRALAGARDHRHAITAIALGGSQDAVSRLGRWTNSRDRSTRQCALAGLLRLGGVEAGARLAACMTRQSDRRFIMGHLPPDAGVWAIPLGLAGLHTFDTRGKSLELLRRMAGDGAPRDADPGRWRRFFKDQLQATAPGTQVGTA